MREPREDPNTKSDSSPARDLQKEASLLAKLIQPWQFLLGLVVGGVLTALAFYLSIKNIAQSSVLDEKFISNLSARVRPSCIFNTDGSIESDFGASEYIESEILITPIPKNFSYEITLRCKRHLAYAPLITGANAIILQISSRRGKGHDWVIMLGPGETLPSLLNESEMDLKIVRRFKLEILH